jgi:hypothetical protein
VLPSLKAKKTRQGDTFYMHRRKRKEEEEKEIDFAAPAHCQPNL